MFTSWLALTFIVFIIIMMVGFFLMWQDSKRTESDLSEKFMQGLIIFVLYYLLKFGILSLIVSTILYFCLLVVRNIFYCI
jgi:hypothetical protein